MNDLDPTVALAGRRSVQLIRAWRQKDVQALNGVLAECGDPGEATGILIHLLGTVSDLLACLPDDKVNEILNNTLLDYWQAEP